MVMTLSLGVDPVVSAMGNDVVGNDSWAFLPLALLFGIILGGMALDFLQQQNTKYNMTATSCVVFDGLLIVAPLFIYFLIFLGIYKPDLFELLKGTFFTVEELLFQFPNSNLLNFIGNDAPSS